MKKLLYLILFFGLPARAQVNQGADGKMHTSSPGANTVTTNQEIQGGYYGTVPDTNSRNALPAYLKLANSTRVTVLADTTDYIWNGSQWFKAGQAKAASAGTLTGSTLAAGVTASSLTSAAGGLFGSNAYSSVPYYPLTGNPSGFLSSFNEADPLVPAYAKSLNSFSAIQSATDALYLPLSYTPSWAALSGKPGTLAGYGITDAYPLTGNPSGFLSSFNEADPLVPAYAKSLNSFSAIQSATDALYLPLSYTPSWASLSGKPGTLAGYGITDAYPLTGNPSGFLTSFNEADPLVPAYAKSLNSFSAIQSATDALYLPLSYTPSWAALSGKPGTLSGYGITDAYPLTGNPSGFLTSYTETDPTVPAYAKSLNSFNDIISNADFVYMRLGYTPSWSAIADKPTTLSGYAITDAYPLTGNPSGFLTSFSESDPLVPAYAKSLNSFSAIQSATDALYLPLSYTPSWASLSGKPNTLSGYGITDAYPLTGNPSGFLTSFSESDPTVPAYAKSLNSFSAIRSATDALYLPLSYTPSWAALSGKPGTLSGYGITDAYPLTGNPSGFLTSFSESDPTVPAYAKGLSGFAAIRSGTDPLYIPKLLDQSIPGTYGRVFGFVVEDNMTGTYAMAQDSAVRNLLTNASFFNLESKNNKATSYSTVDNTSYPTTQATDNRYLKLTGGTLSGPLNTGGNTIAGKTEAAGDNSVKLASTAFVATAIANSTAASGFIAGDVVYSAAPVTTRPGFLLCDGSLVPRGEFPELFAAIGETYGAGDGTTTFALPDYRDRFARVYNGGAGLDPWRVFGAVQGDALQGHTMGMPGSGARLDRSDANNGSSSVPITNVAKAEYKQNSNSIERAAIVSDGINGTPRTAAETRPVNYSINAYIKY